MNSRLATRLIAMGHAALMEGFNLIGLETYPDADQATLEQLLAKLVTTNQNALLFLETTSPAARGPGLTACATRAAKS